MKKVLVTAFDPFGGESVNPAWEAVQLLNTKSFESIHVIVKQIPTVFRCSIQSLKQAIAENQPDIVICVGQAGGRSDITVERVAINVDDARIPDNQGFQPIDEPVVAGGPVAYWSTLPIKAMVLQMRAAGIPSSVSQTAGTFVCNHLFYGLCHLIATKFPNMRGGFVHIPYLPEQVVHKAGQPSMGLEHVVKGLEIIVKTSVAYDQDIQMVGGQIS